MEIEFHGQYDKKTVFEAVKLANKPSRRNAFIRIGLVVLIAAIFIAYYVSISGKQDISSFETFRSYRHLIGVPLVLYFLLQPYISAYQTANNLWKNPVMQKPLAGGISSQGIAYISASRGRREIDWGSFAKKQITGNLIVLLTADGVLSFFPRHFFKTDNDWQIVVQWVNSKVIEPI